MAKTVTLGTQFRIADDSDNPTPVGHLTQISTPSPTKPEIDVTDFDSTAAEFLSGLTDNGEVSMTGFYDYADGGQGLLFEDANSATAPERDCAIEFVQQGVVFSFTGFVKSFSVSAGGVGEAVTFTATVRVTGASSATPVS